jgi:hypothetical protein
MTTIVLRVSALTALLLALSARDTTASIFGRSPALSRSSQWGLLSEKRIQHFCSLDALTLLRRKRTTRKRTRKRTTKVSNTEYGAQATRFSMINIVLQHSFLNANANARILRGGSRWGGRRRRYACFDSLSAHALP